MTENIEQRHIAEQEQSIWHDWLRRYDAQQEFYVEARERRFELMFSLLEELLPGEIMVLDLMAGPGAISERLLRRFPLARAVAVDVDPVLLRLGELAIGDCSGRLRWVRANVTDPGWVNALDDTRFDAVLSTVAIHWLRPPDMARVYQQVAELLTPGGVLLSGDLLPIPASQARVRAAIRGVDAWRQATASGKGAQSWHEWWNALRAENSLRKQFAERDRLWPPGSAVDREVPGQAFHEAALVEAGFAEHAVVWQDLEERLLLAIR